MLVCGLLRKDNSIWVTIYRKFNEAYRGMIMQKSLMLFTETKFSLGVARLLSSARGPAGVATTNKAIIEIRTTSVWAIMMRYGNKWENGRMGVDRGPSLRII
jgi:hypothetical protein